MQRKGFGPRIIAWLIDVFLVIIVVSVLSFFFSATIGAVLGGSVGGPVGGVAGAGLGAYVLTTPLFALLAVGYGLIEAFTGASPGKRILGLKIREADGDEAATSHLLVRYAVKHSGSALAFLAGVLDSALLQNLGTLAGMLIMLGFLLTLGASRQALHDKLTGTAVFNG